MHTHDPGPAPPQRIRHIPQTQTPNLPTAGTAPAAGQVAADPASHTLTHLALELPFSFRPCSQMLPKLLRDELGGGVCGKGDLRMIRCTWFTKKTQPAKAASETSARLAGSS